MQTTFDETEFAPYTAAGTGSVTGQAFVKTMGGDVKFGAGDTVVLMPATTYTTEIYNRQIVGGEILSPIDKGFQKYDRTTIADGSGNFEFHDLPAGTYYVTCSITWEAPSQYGLVSTGGIAYGTVKVGPGETSKVVVTR